MVVLRERERLGPGSALVSAAEGAEEVGNESYHGGRLLQFPAGKEVDHVDKKGIGQAACRNWDGVG